MRTRYAIKAAAVGLMMTAASVLVSAHEREGETIYPSGVRVFKSGVEVVFLGVTVTDAHHKDLIGLAKQDFQVFEDGRPQEVQYFAAESTPLDLAILLDTSASMGGMLLEVREAALQLASALRPGDRASFTEVKRGLRDLQPLSSDTSGLPRAIRSITPGGSTAIYDAIHVGLQTLAHASRPNEVRRQALVVLSDGDDTASLLRYDDVLESVRRHGVTIYAVSLRFNHPLKPRRIEYDPNHVHGDQVLRSLARQTGGEAYFNLSGKELARACRRIATELSHQYALGYISNNTRGEARYRQLSVQVPSAPGARARTRQGYFPAPAGVAAMAQAHVSQSSEAAGPLTLTLSPRRGEGTPSPRLRGEGRGEGSQAASTTEHVRGTLASVEAERITVTTANGPVVMKLTPETKFGAVVASDRSRITDGSFVGITSVAQPDGSQHAVEVHLFSESLRGTGEGSYAWDLPGARGGASRMSNGQVTASKMTNGTVAVSGAGSGAASASKMTNGTAAVTPHGGSLTVRYEAGGSSGAQIITIPPGIPIVAVEPGTRADLLQGAHVFVVARRAADGTVTADRILAGRNGAVPPM